MTKYILILSTLFFQVTALGARPRTDNVDLMCRDKAKEVAAQTYKTCIVENKTAKLDAIKKKYDQRLKAMKAQYESELESLGAKRSRSKPVKTVRVAKPSTPEPETVEESPYSDDQIEASESSSEEMDIPEPIPVD